MASVSGYGDRASGYTPDGRAVNKRFTMPQTENITTKPIMPQSINCFPFVRFSSPPIKKKRTIPIRKQTKAMLYMNGTMAVFTSCTNEPVSSLKEAADAKEGTANVDSTKAMYRFILLETLNGALNNKTKRFSSKKYQTSNNSPHKSTACTL